MDIFRLPKYAAYFYESQIPPRQRVVLRAATIWSMGDRSGGGNDPLVIFSNCDELDIFIGDNHYGRFQPDRESFPILPHPPYQIKGLNLWLTWGQELPDLRIVGYINGEQVAEHSVASDGIPYALSLIADDAELWADNSDMTRLIFKITDRYGNRLPYANEIVTLEMIEGADRATLIGENPFALIGGQSAIYLKAKATPGIITVRAKSPRLEPVEVKVRLLLKPETVG
jgi:beta-galactosidase